MTKNQGFWRSLAADLRREAVVFALTAVSGLLGLAGFVVPGIVWEWWRPAMFPLVTGIACLALLRVRPSARMLVAAPIGIVGGAAALLVGGALGTKIALVATAGVVLALFWFLLEALAS